LLARAQQRLKEKERVDRAVAEQQLNTSVTTPTVYLAASFRQPSPVRGSTDDLRRSASATYSGTSQNAAPLLPPAPDASKEGRLQRENQRLAEELAFLTRENQKLRSGADGALSAAEGSKLQLQLEVLRQQLRETEAESQRSRQYLEAQLEDAKAHAKDVSDELKAYSATASQYEVLCRDKDQQLAAEQQTSAKLRTELQERLSELSRLRDEHGRSREDDTMRLERTVSLLEDAKRQRLHLTELNDKFCRDKEAAVADRRRLQEDVRRLQAEVATDREKHADEVALLRREVDRLRGAVAEKERVLSSQLRDETKAKEHLQQRLLDTEEALAGQTAGFSQQLRQQQETARKEMDDAQRTIIQLTERCRASERTADDVREEVEQRLQRERATLAKEAADKTQQVKDQRDEALDRLRRAEAELATAVGERDHYRAELEKAADVASDWQRAKDKAETQCTKLSTSLAMVIAQDEQLLAEKERLHVDLEQALSDLSATRADLESYFHAEQQAQELSAENDRLSEECGRLAKERNELILENGRLAEEMLKWRAEVRELMGTSSSASLGSLGGGTSSSRAPSTSLGIVRRR
jgi:chromosome segregation ATPase